MMAAPFLTRVVLKNFRSIEACDVQLGPLTFIVGPNGSGKSNFLDGLRFLSDALDPSLDNAVRERGGIGEVRTKHAGKGRPRHVGLRIEFNQPDQLSGSYAFEIGAQTRGGYEVLREECRLRSTSGEAYFAVANHKPTTSAAVTPAIAPDRLYLVVMSGLPEFRPLYDALSHMGFYNLNPHWIRELQSPDPGDVLDRDGSNLAGVLDYIARRDPDTKGRIEAYLQQIAPSLVGVHRRGLGPMETLEFVQESGTDGQTVQFLAQGMSDGTLRALGVLVALFQGRVETAERVPLVGIEEPEVALHPAAAGVLFDALREASEVTQVLVTSHSPDLLDNKYVQTGEILAVDQVGGLTRIGPINDTGRKMLRDQLFTPGELLRMDRLRPVVSAPERSPDLFEHSAA